MGFFDDFIDVAFEFIGDTAEVVWSGVEAVGSTLETIGDAVVYQEPSRLVSLLPDMPRAPGLVGSFIDNVLRDRVTEPAVGSIVWCDLMVVEHSGIYVGAGHIVHLEGDGRIRLVSAQEFLDRLDGFNTAISIYVSCIDSEPVGDPSAAERACSMLGMTRDYSLFLDNCHQFTAGCLTGDFENAANLFSVLEGVAKRELGMNAWRVWAT